VEVLDCSSCLCNRRLSKSVECIAYVHDPGASLIYSRVSHHHIPFLLHSFHLNNSIIYNSYRKLNLLTDTTHIMQRMHVSKLQLQPYASQDPLRLACLSKVASVTHLAVVGGSQGEAPGTCLCYEGKGTIPQSPSLSPFVAAAAPSWLPNEDKNQRATELARWEDLARMLASHAPFPTIKLSCIPGTARFTWAN